MNTQPQTYTDTYKIIQPELPHSPMPSANGSSKVTTTGCQHLLLTGKNKGNHCGCKISKDNLCAKHKQMMTKENSIKYGNYGNPDQAELWLKWVNSV